MNGSVQNFEEAANIASEFIYSLDNLPHEVNHILQEIRVKEARAQELQQDIDKDAAKYIRHSVRASTSVPSSPSSRAPSPKSTALPGKIDAAYAEINQLSAEKCALAQTLVDLITRTRARLDSDLAKVRILQGETVDYASALGSSLSAVPGLGMAGFSDKLATAQLSDSLRSALTSTPTIPDLRQTPVPASSSSLTVAAGPAQKKRRVAASSIKLASASPIKHRSASPTTTAPLTTTQRVTSRLSRQSITRQEAEADMDEGDEDAEGEDAEADDERLYCFCQKQSYGDMIACDNEGDCPFEWFHLSCVGMKQPTPEKWYCSVCLQNMAGNTKKTPAPAVGRKGRKK